MAQLHYEAFNAASGSWAQARYVTPPVGAEQGAPLAPPAARPPGVGRLVSLAGALLSVMLVGGVGVWSYRLMVRDVAGVPVIRALEGPMRISPAEPGGRQAAYQGLSVNTVAAEGGAASAAQVIALAPPPLALSEEDRTAAALAARAGSPITAPGPAALVPISTPATAQAATAGAPMTLIAATVPGISRSPVPRPRPGTSARAASPASGTPAQIAANGDAQAEALLQELVTRLSPAQSVLEIDPDTLAAGTRLVQFGAYADAASARAAWDELAARFPDYLQGRGRIVEVATAGGSNFYRLRAHGFADEPEARRFCTVFLAERIGCLPVLARRTQ